MLWKQAYAIKKAKMLKLDEEKFPLLSAKEIMIGSYFFCICFDC